MPRRSFSSFNENIIWWINKLNWIKESIILLQFLHEHNHAIREMQIIKNNLTTYISSNNKRTKQSTAKQNTTKQCNNQTTVNTSVIVSKLASHITCTQAQNVWDRAIENYAECGIYALGWHHIESDVRLLRWRHKVHTSYNAVNIRSRSGTNH